MTWSRLSWSLVALQVATLAAAQSPPHYDGTWTRSQPPLPADSSHLEEIELRGVALRIRVERRGSGGSLAYGFSDDRTYTIDGPAESTRDDEGRIRTVGVHWEGPNIVFVRTTVEGANTTIEREMWLVSDDGRTLTRERQTMDWRGVRTERVVFAKTEQKLRR
jgi:hypothetical protein